ncbi:MAG TPA: signal peptidase I [Blastocatellia bacterium]|jgi:signal peptidase I|nr:signal peptidase I [Blastocatellia bacterium]
MKRDKFVGIAPDDDNDIRIIEDISSTRVAGSDSGDLWGELRSLLRDVIFAGVIAILIVGFVVQPVRVEGQSMMPKLHDQDRIFVNKFIYPLREWIGDKEPIKRGDIVVLLYPDDPSKSYIKRVVGLPGEEVNVENGKLYINGMQIDEPYLDTEYISSDSMPGSVHVKEHHYFVMGDNRRNSSDSRYWGLVPEKYIYGKAIFRYYPFTPIERVGAIE